MAGRGGRRAGAGRKPGVKLPDVADRNAAGRLLEALNKPAGNGKRAGDGEEQTHKDDYETAQWRKLTEAADLRIRLDSRKYLYDKRDGKAVQPMDFGNKPISVIVDLGSAVTRRAGGNR